jgi:hypothetical protein
MMKTNMMPCVYMVSVSRVVWIFKFDGGKTYDERRDGVDSCKLAVRVHQERDEEREHGAGVNRAALDDDHDNRKDSAAGVDTPGPYAPDNTSRMCASVLPAR